MENKLINMVDFVISMRENKNKDNISRFWACERYAEFLNRPLELNQFVPCDLKGNVLSEKYNGKSDDRNKSFTYLANEYQEAKERCLFEGIEYVKVEKYSEYFYLIKYNQCIIWISKDTLVTVEDMVKYNLELTPTSLKQLGL